MAPEPEHTSPGPLPHRGGLVCATGCRLFWGQGLPPSAVQAGRPPKQDGGPSSVPPPGGAALMFYRHFYCSLHVC